MILEFDKIKPFGINKTDKTFLIWLKFNSNNF